MSVMTATAVITAVDRASAVFARVGAAARAAGGRFGAAAAGVSRFGDAALMNLGLPAAMAGAVAARGEFEVDRVARQMQAVGELTERQRDMLTDKAFDASLVVGEKAQDLIRAQKELIQGGLDADTVGQITTDIAKVAKTNEMQIADVAEMGINAARALGMEFDTTAQKVESIKKALSFMSVVPSASTESVEGLRESLKYSAPIAGMLKIELEELGAALSILADSGFKGEEGGTAFRTILLRGIAPTKQLAQAYRAAGIELNELYKLDEAKINDNKALRERILGAGIGGNQKVIDRALKKAGGLEKYDGLYQYQDALMERLSDALDIGPGDAQNKGILKKVIDQHIFTAMDGFDLEKFMNAIGRLPDSDFAKVAGIQRAAQAAALQKNIKRLQPLFDQFRERMPGAIDRMFEPLDDGFAISLERISAALSKVRHAIFDSGFGKGIADVFHDMAAGIETLSRTSPGVLNAVGAGLVALVAAPAAGAVIWGISTSLGALAAVMSSPVWATLLAAGGIAALFGDWSSWTNGGMQITDSGAWVNTGSALQEIASSLGDVGSALGSLGGESFTALYELSAAVGDVIKEISSLMGMNIEGSVIASGFRSLAELIKGLAEAVKYIRETIGSVGDLSSKIDQDYQENVRKSDEWWKGQWQYWMGGDGQQQSSYDPRKAADEYNAAEGSRIWHAGGTLTPAQELAYSGERSDKSRSVPLIQDSTPKTQNIQVDSRVSGEATVTNRFEIVVTAPPGFGATLNGNRSSTTTVPLNTGESMPDTAGAQK